jgi:hypothetical protein
MNVELSKPFQSASYVTNIPSAERGQLAAGKVDGASYEVVCTEGDFSSSPGNSIKLSLNQLGVRISFETLLSKIQYESELDKLREISDG